MRVSVRSAYWTSSSVLRRYVAPGVFLSPKSGRRSHTSASMERPYRFQAIRVSRLFQYYGFEQHGGSSPLRHIELLILPGGNAPISQNGSEGFLKPCFLPGGAARNYRFPN